MRRDVFDDLREVLLGRLADHLKETSPDFVAAAREREGDSFASIKERALGLIDVPVQPYHEALMYLVDLTWAMDITSVLDRAMRQRDDSALRATAMFLMWERMFGTAERCTALVKLLQRRMQLSPTVATESLRRLTHLQESLHDLRAQTSHGQFVKIGGRDKLLSFAREGGHWEIGAVVEPDMPRVINLEAMGSHPDADAAIDQVHSDWHVLRTITKKIVSDIVDDLRSG